MFLSSEERHLYAILWIWQSCWCFQSENNVFFFLLFIQKAVFLFMMMIIMWEILYVLCFWWLWVIKCLVHSLKKVIFILETCIFYIHTVKQTLCKTNKGFVTNADRWFNPNRDYLHPVIFFTKLDALYIFIKPNIEFLILTDTCRTLVVKDGS